MIPLAYGQRAQAIRDIASELAANNAGSVAIIEVANIGISKKILPANRAAALSRSDSALLPKKSGFVKTAPGIFQHIATAKAAVAGKREEPMKDEFPVVSRKLAGDHKHTSCQIITCSECKAEGVMQVSGSGRIPATVVATAFERRGWMVGQIGKHVCPDCIKKKEAKPMKPYTNGVSAPAKPTPTPAASRKIAEVYMALEDAYDRELKRYRGNKTDASIAAELDVAEVLVRDRREQDFGPIVQDTSREDIEKNLTLIRTEAARIKSEAEAVRAKMDMLVSLCGNVIGFAVMVKTSIDKAAQGER